MPIYDTDRVQWLDKDPENRLENVKWRVINEGCDLRAAIDWFIQKDRAAGKS